MSPHIRVETTVKLTKGNLKGMGLSNKCLTNSVLYTLESLLLCIFNVKLIAKASS